MNLNLLLKKIFILIFLIIIGEISYFVYINQLNDQKNININNMRIGNINSKMSIISPTPTLVVPLQYSDWDKKRSTVVTSSFAQDIANGQIIDIKKEINMMNYFQMTIRGSRGQHVFSFSKSDEHLIKIIQFINGKEELLTVDDLQINDTIIIEENWNTFNDIPKIISIKIERK